MKADTELKVAETEKSKQDWRYDPSRVLIEAVLATAGMVGAIAALLGYFIGRHG